MADTLDDRATAVEAMTDVPLFHWAPTTRRKQIIRYGLRPLMRITTSSNTEGWRAPHVCFADTPSWAWALSGGMNYSPSGEWDLWQVWMNCLSSPVILPSADRPSGIHEVRTSQRVFKRDIWYVGSRVKP